MGVAVVPDWGQSSAKEITILWVIDGWVGKQEDCKIGTTEGGEQSPSE